MSGRNIWSNDCYNQVCHNSCYDNAGRNSCYDEAVLNSCYNKAGRNSNYDEAGRIGILLRILPPGSHIDLCNCCGVAGGERVKD